MAKGAGPPFSPPRFLFFGDDELPEQQQILIVQKRDAPKEKAKAIQSNDMTFVPMVSLMP